MGKWNLVREFAGGQIVDTIEGPYRVAEEKARKLEKANNWDIVIYETLW